MSKILISSMFMLWVSVNIVTAILWSKLTPTPTAKNFKLAPAAYYRAYVFHPMMYAGYGFVRSEIKERNLNGTKMQDLPTSLSNFYNRNFVSASNNTPGTLHHALKHQSAVPEALKTVTKIKSISNNKTLGITPYLDRFPSVDEKKRDHDEEHYAEDGSKYILRRPLQYLGLYNSMAMQASGETSMFLICIRRISKNIATDTEPPKKKKDPERIKQLKLRNS